MPRRTIFVVLALAAVAGLGLYLYGGSATPPGQPPLTRIEPANFSELRTVFNQSKDSVRVVALLSPT